MSRFVAENNIKKPDKMLHLIQYFIWYQMITGLIQLTVLSAYILYYVPYTSLSYTIWLMLITVSKQYPGFLGVFRNALDALQQYNKRATIDFLMGNLWQRVTEISFIYIGRIYGQLHPKIGELMGISIGSCIGLYIDDFLAMVVAAKFFSSTMNKYGIRAKVCFFIDFTWQEIKPVLWFGIKTGFPGLISSLLSVINLWIWVTYVNQYTSYLILALIGGSIADVIAWFGQPNITPLVSESYMNGKKKLTKYYIGQLIRFYALIQGFIVPLIIIVTDVLPIAWDQFGLVNYKLGLNFVIPKLVYWLFQPYASVPGQVIYGANKPNFGVLVGILNSILNTVLLYLFLAVWKLTKLYGITAIAWLITCNTVPMQIVFMIISYIYVHKKIVKVKLLWAQTFFSIPIASISTFFLLYLIRIYLFEYLFINYGFFLAAVVGVLAMFFTMIFCFFPLSAILGAWDDTNLNEFRKAAMISGPSKFIVWPLYKTLEKTCKISPLHGRFEMPIKGVVKEAQELIALKIKSREEFKKQMEALQ